ALPEGRRAGISPGGGGYTGGAWDTLSRPRLLKCRIVLVVVLVVDFLLGSISRTTTRTRMISIMSQSDKQSIIARLWCYICLIPEDLSPAYALQADAPPDRDGLWLELLGDLAENRLRERSVQERYMALFDDPGRA